MDARVTGIGQKGLGLRRVMLDPLLAGIPEEVDFFEVAPENWIGPDRPAIGSSRTPAGTRRESRKPAPRWHASPWMAHRRDRS